MIELSDIRVSYDGVQVLDGVSLTVAPGEIVALVGDNGCGKSTLGRVVCAAQLVDEGGVAIDGHDPSVSELERLRVRALVGRVCQDPVDQIVSSLVYDEVAFGPRNLGLVEDEVDKRVRGALDRVGMSAYAGRVTTLLSGGEQQRIALAGVLAMNPRYLVLDEPTAQLDPAVRAQLRSLFWRLAHEDGLGVVLITHDELEIELADRVVDVAGLNGVASSPKAYADSGEARVEDLAAPGAASPGVRDGEPVLEMSGVSFAYGARSVLRDVSLTLHAGEVVLLAGSSGAGKSTLAALAAGLMEPDAGTIRLRRAVPSRVPDVSATLEGPRARNVEMAAWSAPVPGSVGLSFQQPEAQFFLDTVYDEIAYAPRNLSCTEAEVDARVRAAMASVGLDGRLAGASPFELSGGQARRVALASVLSLDAPVYVLDEPSAALDARARAAAHGMAARLAAAGRSVLVITHDVDEWRLVATRVLELEDGAIRELPPVRVGEGAPVRESLGEGRGGAPDAAVHFPVPVQAAGGAPDAARAPSAPAAPLEGRQSARRVPAAHGSHKGSGGPFTSFGEYVPGTPAARLDARVKVVLLLLATAGVLAAHAPGALAVWFAILCGCLASARMRMGRVLLGMRPVAIVLTFTLLANLVSCDGRGAIEVLGPIALDPAGGMRGLMAVARIVVLVGLSLTVASSTTATQLSDACVRLLSPLARLGVAIAPLGTVLALALRFVPLVSEELNRIRLAQSARGAHFDSGSLVGRMGAWASVLTPLMIGLFRRADRLAEAMAARCYDAVAAGRLSAPRPLAARDKVVLVMGIAACALAVLLGR